MTLEESKCGDSCALVEMLATKTSKEQAMENAIAAVLTDNISQRGAAKRFGVSRETLRDRLRQDCRVGETAHHTTQESKPAPTKPTDEERQEWWRLHTEEGLTTNAIHKKTGRNRETITKEIKRREAAATKTDPVPTPNLDQPEELLTPTGQIGAHTKSIVAREKKTLQEKINQVKQIRELNKELELYWKPLRKNWEKYGRAVVLGNLSVAEKIFLRDGVLQPLADSLDLPKESSLEDCLWAMQKEAKEIEKNIRTVLYFYNCILSLTVEERPS